MSYQSLPSHIGILDFWFAPDVQPNWFVKDSAFDDDIRHRFGKIFQEVVETVGNGKELKSGEEALTFVIVLDQFSRNMFRGSSQAFATDEMAIHLSKAAIKKGLDKELSSAAHANFLYMPFMHSENLEDQEEGIHLFSRISDNNQTVAYAKQHRDIIARFGRFPHRNEILGRISTPAEMEFLKEFQGF